MTAKAILLAAALTIVSSCGSPLEPAAFPTPPPGVPPELYEAVVEDLSDRLSGTPALVSVTVEDVNWSDAALGCPRPGELTVQVITPGYRLVFTVDGTTYEYHASQRGDFRLCA